jgi:CubicO group peptidase (beta-lactamase class C family)
MTGIQSDGNKLLKLFERKKFNSLDEEVTEFAKKEIQDNPGIAFRYSNIGLNIAARVVEVVTKKKFDALIKRVSKIF